MTALTVLAAAAEAFKVELVNRGEPGWGAAAPWLVALSALAFSIYQYVSNTRVKRLEYLDGVAKRMHEESLLRVATQMLDWEVRTIEFEEKRYVFGVTMLQRALMTHNDGEGCFVPAGDDRIGFDETETLIRDAFDAFFGLLENLQYAVHLRVLTQENVFATPLAYYLGKLLEKDIWTNCAICNYLRTYGFPKTEQMLQCYRIEHPSKAQKLSPETVAIYEGELSTERDQEALRKAAEKEEAALRVANVTMGLRNDRAT